jgi:polysaccharide export outer membrane protein
MKHLIIHGVCVAMLCTASVAVPGAQVLKAGPANATATGIPAEPALPKFVIGVGDVLSLTFWREERLSREVLVRPDGKISVPLLNDVQAAGYTPEELGGALAAAAAKYITEPDVTVIVKEIHSRRVFVVGQVVTPGAVPLTSGMTVLQVLAMVGGVHEYADQKHIAIIRMEQGREKRFRFNYDEVVKGHNVKQNILLQPDDTIVVR